MFVLREVLLKQVYHKVHTSGDDDESSPRTSKWFKVHTDDNQCVYLAVKMEWKQALRSKRSSLAQAERNVWDRNTGRQCKGQRPKDGRDEELKIKGRSRRRGQQRVRQAELLSDLKKRKHQRLPGREEVGHSVMKVRNSKFVSAGISGQLEDILGHTCHEDWNKVWAGQFWTVSLGNKIKYYKQILFKEKTLISGASVQIKVSLRQFNLKY